MFVDEAYSLVDTGNQSKSMDRHSVEAIRTLLTECENCRTDTVIVLAGYQDKIKKLMRADPGLTRRFPKTVHLVDYSLQELAAITCRRAMREYALRFDDAEVEGKLAMHIEDQHSLRMSTENASLAVHLLEGALDRG